MTSVLGPQLAFEALGCFFEGSAVGAGRQVLPAAIGDDERDVGPLPRLHRALGLPESGMQDRAGGDAREDALRLDELARTPKCVCRSHGETGVEHRRVIELGDETLVDVAQAVYELAIAGLGRDDA